VKPSEQAFKSLQSFIENERRRRTRFLKDRPNKTPYQKAIQECEDAEAALKILTLAAEAPQGFVAQATMFNADDYKVGTGVKVASY